MKRVDLRSDTVTLPSQAMRDAMYKAELGDDGYGEDPTINKLQEIAAQRFGKEAGLFVASGTMGNLVSLLTHCGRGDEAIVGNNAHLYRTEQGGMASLAGIHPRVLINQPDGTLDLNEFEQAINIDNIHFARTRLICLENTFNGRILKPDYISQVASISRKHSLKMHLDGARIFNAAIALDIPVEKLTTDFDTVQFCFSKGLAAPAGSMICGDQKFIEEATRNRKLVGGGMRQVGVLAAAAIVALDEMVDRLEEDHVNARYLAEGLAAISHVDVDPKTVETNMVFFGLKDPSQSASRLAQELSEQGVLVIFMGAGRIRAVTHYGIEKPDIDQALKIIKQSVSKALVV